jgi:hypothetical protein
MCKLFEGVFGATVEEAKGHLEKSPFRAACTALSAPAPPSTKPCGSAKTMGVSSDECTASMVAAFVRLSAR